MAGILRAGKYFSIYEVVHSDVAEEKGIFNLPLKEDIIDNLNYCIGRMDEIREGYGKPIYINSWYRCKELNEAVDGAKNSYHMSGLAVDIRYDKDLLDYLTQNPQFDKLNLEKAGKTNWLHIQFKRDRSKEMNRVLSITK
ncbi:MAG: peptidase M15 [Bacteroidales bacterium]|nr:peptidase M15 [Bacteroidales bacterium]